MEIHYYNSYKLVSWLFLQGPLWVICVSWRHIFEIMFFHVSLASVLLDTDVHEQHQGCSFWNSTFTTPEHLQDPTGRKRRSNANGSGIVEALFPACPRDSDLRRKHSQRERACSPGKLLCSMPGFPISSRRRRWGEWKEESRQNWFNAITRLLWTFVLFVIEEELEQTMLAGPPSSHS